MQGLISRVRLCYSVAVAFGVSMVLAAVAKADPPTLPDTGVDIAAYIPVVATAVSLTILACVGVYFGWQVIRMGISWFSSVGRRQ